MLSSSIEASSLGETWLQSFYRSVVTSALVGLDTVPRNDSSRLLSIFMVIAGVTIFALVASTLVESIARGVLTGALAEKRRRRAIERLRDHYIICGYGRVGQQIGSELRAAGANYVVVDFHKEALAVARERNDYFIEGDGTDEEDLEAAGLPRARGLVASSDSDADNVYITLSARAVRPELLGGLQIALVQERLVFERVGPADHQVHLAADDSSRAA